ncbi:MAG: hypothetical protein LBE92_14265 [Chryseobacterium sp.]|jgi:hypothetical protein|uniref:hypothetical protein n=1 Tax=Chryseobacterium sp. TaxID=1871047 RepID=UPI00281BF5F6|nr:hypothetical protein [Chryseobacterium sp.]MDR2237283.1 hypothetical protein [Chryseobacterium sp.]
MTTDRLFLASKSLTGVSIGDAFGERFFGEENTVPEWTKNVENWKNSKFYGH